MGLWTDDDVKRILEELEPIANWTAESKAPPDKAIQEQAGRAKAVIRGALDRINQRSPSWPLCVARDCDDCRGCCGG